MTMISLSGLDLSFLNKPAPAKRKPKARRKRKAA